MFERFSNRARRVVVLAQEEARRLDHNYIGTEHLLVGLLLEADGLAAHVLVNSGIELESVRTDVEAIIGRAQRTPPGRIPFTPRAKKVLELSLREALALGDNHIGTEHILLGLLREDEGVAAQVLIGRGLSLERTRQAVIDARAARESETVDYPGTAGVQWGRCSFCGAPMRGGRRFLAGRPGIFICDQCVRLAGELLQEPPPEEPGPGPTVIGE